MLFVLFRVKIVISLQSDYVELQGMKDTLEQQIKNTHSDTNHWESELNRITKENNDLKRQLRDGKVSIWFYKVSLSKNSVTT